MEKEKKKNCRPLAAERSAAAMFVLFFPSTRIFQANLVYMVLGSSYLSAKSSASRQDPIARAKYKLRKHMALG